MTKFADHLWNDLAGEHAATLALADRHQQAPARRLARPRVLLGAALGLGGIGTALALTVAGSPAAYAITAKSDGSVLVSIDQSTSLPQANAKLAAMGIDEQVSIQMATGAATRGGPVACTPAPGAAVSGPPIEVLVGANGTEVNSEAAGATGAGTFHLDSCSVRASSEPGTGATGAG